MKIKIKYTIQTASDSGANSSVWNHKKEMRLGMEANMGMVSAIAWCIMAAYVGWMFWLLRRDKE